MRKLIAVLCVVAMILVMAAPALAAPSITVVADATTEGVVVSSLDEEDPAEDIANEAAKSVVEAVNGEGSLTPTEAVLDVLGKDAKEELKEVENYSFASQFHKISAPKFPVDVAFEGTDENTKIMLIDPKTGELVIILPNADGSFTFPFAGIFALMAPTPEE